MSAMPDTLNELPAELFAPPRADLLPVGTAEVAMRKLFPVEHPYAKDPVGWAESKGIFLWSKQKEILRAAAAHRYVAVPSCHDSGKSFIAAVLVCWWLDVHPVGDAFVVSTAPSDVQVKSILWREIQSLHREYNLNGRITLDAQWYMGADERTLVAYGRKPQAYANSDQAMQAFQGIHAEFVLIIVDEACGVPEWLFTAADSLATNEAARVLAIGNPDDPASHFEKVCRPGSGWFTIWISAKDTPNFTGEWVPAKLRRLLLSKQWVRERIKRWGKRSARFISKVLGRFPQVSTDTIISPSLVLAAHARDLSGEMIGADDQYGVDVARFGTDESCIYHNRGGVIRLRWSAHKMPTTETTGNVLRVLDEDDVELEEIPVVVDEVGVGSGVVDMGIERGLRIIPFNAGARAMRPHKFANRGAEAWWAFKLLMEEGLIDLDPEDEDLASQLQSRKYKTDSAGRIHIESKDDMKKRGLPSPDRADAAVQSVVAFPADDYEEETDEPADPLEGTGLLPDEPPSAEVPMDNLDSITGDLLEREM